MAADGGFAAEDWVAEEHAGQDSADQAAETVDAEGVEAVVVTQFAFEYHGSKITSGGSEDTERQCAARINEACRRRDADQTGNRAGSQAEG